LPIISAASAAAWSGVGVLCQMYGWYCSTISSGSAVAQMPAQTIRRDASSVEKTGLACGGPPMTMNGSFSAMAMASALAASRSSPAPVPV
jgi:hypothetical protein